MKIKLKHLLTAYASAMHEGDAALFIGSGLSRPAGFVDWQGLLADFALEINLRVQHEHDLVAVAQYYLNRMNRDRSALNQTLVDRFYKPGAYTANHRILAQLPVSTIWTTNYDELMEDALRREGKRVDVKKRDRDICWRKNGRHVVLYKMHGDIADPAEIIISKDDYERYARTHPIFQNTLEGDLLTKTLLFLGFSFTDPNLDHMLGHLRSLLMNSKRTHYAIMRKARLNWDKSRAEAEYEFERETVKQILHVENLQRYSIRTFLVDQYKDITFVLRALEQEYKQRIIYVCGGESENQLCGRLAELCQKLGSRLMDQEFRLCCEFDTPVGREVFVGAKAKIDEKQMYPLDRYLLRPLPTKFRDGKSMNDFASTSRSEMISRSGFVIYLGTGGANELNVIKDLELATKLKVSPFLLSGTEAWIAWRHLGRDLKSIPGHATIAQSFKDQRLENFETSELVDALMDLINRQSASQPDLWTTPPMSETRRRQFYEESIAAHPNVNPKVIRRVVGSSL